MIKLFNKKKLASLQLLDIKPNGTMWFKYINNYSTFYKTPLQILENTNLLKHINSNDACTIGVLCGEAYRQSLSSKFNQTPNNFVLTKDYKHFYKIISICRNKTITFEDNNRLRHQLKILILAQDKDLLKKFTPNNAYYIGFLAGVELFSIKNNLIPSIKPRSNLKLVYSRELTASTSKGS